MNIILTLVTIYALGAVFVEILVDLILTFSSKKISILREVVNVSNECNILTHDILNIVKLIVVLGSWFSLFKYIQKKCFI